VATFVLGFVVVVVHEFRLVFVFEDQVVVVAALDVDLVLENEGVKTLVALQVYLLQNLGENVCARFKSPEVVK